MEIRADLETVVEFLLHPLAKGFLETTSDGVIVIDATDRSVVAMNDAARRLMGYGEDEVAGCQCRDLMNSRACVEACPLTALVESRPEGGELELVYRGREEDRQLPAHTRMILVRGTDGDPVAGIEVFTKRERNGRTLAELESHAIDEALAASGGNIARAAKELGIDRSTLWRKVKRR